MRRNRSGYYADKVIRDSDESRVTSPTERETKVREPKYGTIDNAELVRLRKEPEPGSESMGVVRRGSPIEILEKGDDFCKIRTNDLRVAYVVSKYVKED